MPAGWDSIIIGGGFYGLAVAEHLAKKGQRILVVERDESLMRRASYNNQARVHNGYHYPRSVLTAVRSRVNYPRFLRDFESAVVSEFQQLYAIAHTHSKVTAQQFKTFITRVGATLSPVSVSVKKLFDPALIEDVFLTDECAFDAAILGNLMVDRCRNAGVTIKEGTAVTKLSRTASEPFKVVLSNKSSEFWTEESHSVFSCTYSATNEVLRCAGLATIPLKHELTELSLVSPPDEFANLGITVMDGPFFSTMPFPDRKLHTLTHVRYTPHGAWTEGPDEAPIEARTLLANHPATAFPSMIRDVVRYVPSFVNAEYKDSLWEIKTILPQSEGDDSRPILFYPNYQLPGLYIILGGKIDNVYDILESISGAL